MTGGGDPAPPPGGGGGAPRVTAPVLLALGYFALSRAGYALVTTADGLAVIWPPVGLFVGALLVSAPRRWPGLTLAAGVASVAGSLLFGRTLPIALAYFAGNAVLALASAAMVRRLAGGVPSAWTIRGVLLVLLVPAGVFVVAGAGIELAGSSGRIAPGLVWWAGAALGVIAVAPLVLVVVQREHVPVRARRVVEALAVVAAHAAAVIAIVEPHATVYAHELALVPPMLWAAIRFGVRGAAPSALAVALAVVLVGGPDPARTRALTPDDALALQFFLGILLATTIVVGANETERRRSAAALRISRAATDRAADAIAVADGANRIVYANEAWLALLRRPASEVLGRPAALPGDETPEAWRALREGAKGGAVAKRELWPRRGDAVVPYELAASEVDVDGGPHLFVALRDDSDRRRAEEAARLAGVGALAAGVAHEINNPLAYVSGNLDWVRTELQRLLAARAEPAAKLAALDQALADAARGADRVRDILRDLRTFARADDGGSGPVDVERALSSALAFASMEIRHRARLVTDVSKVPPVVGNERRLGQVFLNLLVNAAQAIPEGRVAENEIAVSVRSEAGRVVAEVRDTGRGMAPEVRARIFEPFYTTRAGGGGTGLGLAICHGIVTGMGGTIEVESAPGKGTLFRVVLPAAANAA